MTTKLVPRSITFTIPASSSGDPSVTVNAQEDPSGNGQLDFTATVNTTPSGVIGDLGGLFFDYNDTKLSGLKASGSSVTTYQTGDDNVINIAPGINMDGAVGTPYDVGIAFGTAGIGANRQDIQKASFVLSDPANNLTLDDLHQSGETSQFGARVTSIGTPTSSRSGSDKDTSTGTSIPYAPTASNDSETAPEDQSITITIQQLKNKGELSDQNGATLKFMSASGTGIGAPQYGTVAVASDGQSLTYTPTTLDYEVNGKIVNSADSFQYAVVDSLGGTDSATVNITETPVADTPTVTSKVTGNTAGVTTILATATSEDHGTVNIGSDYIDPITLSVANLPGATLNGTGLVNNGNGTYTFSGSSADQGLLIDTVNVSAPGGTFGTLSIAATADETEAPSVKASNTTTQLIDIPTANPVSTILNEDGTVSIQIINGAASDLNNPIANLKVTGFSQPTYGEVSMGPSGNLIYDPEAGPDPLDYETKGVLTGDQVTFDYTVTNALGGTNSNTVTVTQTPVADTPTVNDSVITPLSTDPATLTRLRVTATSGDHGTVTDGSDYIQSLKLSGVPTNVTLSVPTAGFTLSGPTPDGTTDDYTVTTSGNPGTVAPEIDVSAPTLTSTNFNLGITAVNAETESPTTTASASTSQNIHVEHSTFTQQVAFSATNQSIWGSGDAPTVSFDKFLGIDTHAAGQTTIGSGPTSIFGSLASNNLKLGGSITLKAGFQADLMLNSGSFNATVPFNITLGDTYNEINKTLQVDPTDAQAPGGMIATTGPGGSFGLDFIFDAMASLTAGAHILGFGGTTTAHIGPFDATVPLLHYNTSTSPVSLSFSIEGINISFAWPTINTSGTGPNTVGAQTISASGTSNNFFSLGVDPIALGFDALGIPDPFNFEFGPIGLSLLAANIGVGVSFGQTFDLNGSLPSATLTPQGGTPQTLNFNRGPLILDNAPNQFSLSLTPDATLENNTSLVPTFNAGISALSASVGALSIGPLFSVSTSVPLAHFSFFNSTFPVAFGSQTVSNITV